MKYIPPFIISPTVLNLLARISEAVGRLSVEMDQAQSLRLRRINRIRTIHGSLAIEGNTLSEEQITAILDGKRVLAPPRDITEAHNALAVYDELAQFVPHRETDLLEAHRRLMIGLLPDAGRYRLGGVGVMQGEQVVHMAPPANRVSILMRNLLGWLADTDIHPLISSSVFHYEFEFIHPFSDGNGRMGRLWQTLILSRWQPLFAYIPVESLVHQHQNEYYQALNQSTARSDSEPFIIFMLSMILDAVENSAPPHVTPHATPHVRALLKTIKGEQGRDAIMAALGLSDRKSFSDRYLRPALAEGLIEMTIPDKPRSPMQRYRLTAAGMKLRDEM
ncbi:MAG: cell filamentation protein Fic [Gammaproteobacteria bacterium RIFCSPLOWO2_02_FULL_57_10]|nr:MAG: cell filamentation protein Fic [Gammaproteobacteria bacterium RIFCSPLOWO2_02_FULL_57_10]